MDELFIYPTHVWHTGFSPNSTWCAGILYNFHELVSAVKQNGIPQTGHVEYAADETEEVSLPEGTNVQTSLEVRNFALYTP
jgi:hypothetical protein